MSAQGDESGEEFHTPDAGSDNIYTYKSIEIGFKSPEFARKIRSDPRFQVCSLIVGHQKTDIYAAPNILCQSLFFDNLFTVTNAADPIYLPELNADAVNILINYLYTGTMIYVDCGVTTLQNVILAAKKFSLEEVKSTCLEILTEHLAVDNCLGIRAFASWNQFDTLLDAVSEFVKENFTTLTESNEFVNLGNSDVEEMIATCNRNVTADEVIFKAILRWVKHDESYRENYIYQFLKSVNLGALFDNAPELVIRAFKSEDVLQGKMCKQMYSDMTEAKALESVLEKQRMRREKENSEMNNSSQTFEDSRASEASQTDLDPLPETNSNTTDTGNTERTPKRSRPERSTSSDNQMETEEVEAQRSPSRSPRLRRKATPRKTQNSPIRGNPNKNVASTSNNSMHFQTETETGRTTRSSRRSGLPAREKTPEVPTSPRFPGRTSTSPKMTPSTPRKMTESPKKGADVSPKPKPAAPAEEPAGHLETAPPLKEHTIADKTLVYLTTIDGKQYVDGYNFESGNSNLLGDIKLPRNASSLVYHDEKIFHIGGTLNITDNPEDLSEACKLVKVYKKNIRTADVDLDHLELVAAKRDIGVCICGDYLYTVGGCSGKEDMNCVERLQLNQRLVLSRWEEMPRSMEYIRSTHGVAVLEGKIYAFGGIGFSLNPAPSIADVAVDLKTAECFDPSLINDGDDEPDWHLIGEMNQKRAYLMSGVLNNKIYAMGGSVSCPYMSLRQKLNSVESYDPVRDCWTLCSLMTTCRSGGAVVVQEPLMYVIGGDKSSEPSMEVYDHRINKWIRLQWPTNLSKLAEFSSAIVIDGVYGV